MSSRFLCPALMSLVFLCGMEASGQKQSASAPIKRALIIAIGDYRPSTGWSRINSQNDVPLVKGALVRIGFQEQHIAVLTDTAATREGILKALADLASRTGKGDMIAIHVSAHGQQISDNNSPPEEADGYDEAIIAYGAPSGDRYVAKTRGTSAYDGSRHLRDEDFGNAINAIRIKSGKNGHVLVTLDACHSGTGTRGSSIARGGEPPYDLQGTPPPQSTETDKGGFGLEVESRDGLAKFVVISGALAAEVNYETKNDTGVGVGSLSYCYSKALPTLESKSTYRTLFAKLASEMADKAPKQTPQLEGDVDSEVFGNGFTPQPKFMKASKIIGARQVRVEAGTMMSVGVGTEVVVKSNLDGKLLAKGKVVEASGFDSTVELESDLTERKPVNLQVFVTSYATTQKKIRVSLDSVSNVALKDALTKSLNELGLVELAKKDQSELNVSDAATRSNLVVNINSTAYGSRLMNKPVSGTDVNKVTKDLTDLVQNYAQGQMFKSLDLRDDNFKVVIRIIPLKPGGKSLADTLDYRTFLDKGNVLNLPDGSWGIVEARNLGTKKAYFNIVDLEPNGKINPVYPPIDRKTGLLREQPEVFMLEPGQTLPFICCPFSVSPPYGNEIHKVFATGAPFDLSSTINTRGAEVGTRGKAQSPLEKLMGKSFEKVSTRGTDAEAVNVEEMGTNTFEYVFKIVKKN